MSGESAPLPLPDPYPTETAPPDWSDLPPFRELYEDRQLFKENVAALQALARHGDAPAYELMAWHYRGGMLGTIKHHLAKTGSDRIAEDVVQIALMNVFAALTLRPLEKRPVPTFAYMITAARHAMLDYFGSQKYKRVALSDDPELGEEVQEPSLFYDPEERAMILEEKAVAGRALHALWEHLNERQRELMRLRFIAKRDMKDIGPMFGLDESALKAAFARIYDKIRRLERDGVIQRPDTMQGATVRRTNKFLE